MASIDAQIMGFKMQVAQAMQQAQGGGQQQPQQGQGQPQQGQEQKPPQPIQQTRA
jgi:hypothetical protein